MKADILHTLIAIRDYRKYMFCRPLLHAHPKSGINSFGGHAGCVRLIDLVLLYAHPCRGFNALN